MFWLNTIKKFFRVKGYIIESVFVYDKNYLTSNFIVDINQSQTLLKVKREDFVSLQIYPQQTIKCS